jgi:hypothetical protein
VKTTIQIADDLYDRYSAQAEGMQQRGQAVTAEELMADRLDRFKAVEPGDRVVVIDPAARQELEHILSGGSLFDASDLVKKVKAAISISIGDIRLDFTPGQMRELSNIARRNGRTVDQVVRETVKRMEVNFFDCVQ